MTFIKEDRQASIRVITGTTHNYYGDWDILFDSEDIPAGEHNERLMVWCRNRLGNQSITQPEAMQAFADSLGVDRWKNIRNIPANIMNIAFTTGYSAGYR